MFAAFEIAGFVIVLALAIWSWRTAPHLVMLAAIRGGYAALVLSALAALVGLPLFFFRTAHLSPPPATVTLFSQAHHYAGHIFITLFVLYWPVLMVVSFARPRSAGRKAVLGGLSVLCMLLFLFLSFTGYALPPDMPRELSNREGMHVLRFFVLHVVTLPLLSAAALVLVIWRHRRRSLCRANMMVA